MVVGGQVDDGRGGRYVEIEKVIQLGRLLQWLWLDDDSEQVNDGGGCACQVDVGGQVRS